MSLSGFFGWSGVPFYFGSSFFSSSFFSSISVVISSIGFGGGVVAIVQPIHAPIARMAINAIETRTNTASSLTLVALRLNSPGSATRTT